MTDDEIVFELKNMFEMITRLIELAEVQKKMIDMQDEEIAKLKNRVKDTELMLKIQ